MKIKINKEEFEKEKIYKDNLPQYCYYKIYKWLKVFELVAWTTKAIT